MNFFGLGPRAMTARMRQTGQLSVYEQLEMASELGVRLLVCEVTLRTFGFSADDIDPRYGVAFCGVSTFVDSAISSEQTLFI